MVDGHDISALVAAFGEAADEGPPTVLLAKTFKGAAFLYGKSSGLAREAAQEGRRNPKALDELTGQLKPSSTRLQIKLPTA